MSDQAILDSFDDAVAVISFIADAGLRDAAMDGLTQEHSRRQAVFAEAVPQIRRRPAIHVPPGGSALAELSKRH